MFIGNLNAPASGITIASSFRKCNTTIPLPPDQLTDTSGSLLEGCSASWNWNTLLGTGLDVVLTFQGMKNSVWIGQVILRQAENSALDKVALLRREKDGSLATIGRPQAGQPLSGDITIEAGCFAEELIIRIQTNYRPLQLKEIEIIGAVFDEPILYPIPLEAAALDEEGISVESLQGIYANPNDPDALAAAEYLKELFSDEYGKDLAFLSALPESLSGVIIFEKESANSIAAEGFTIQVKDGCCRIAAADRRGMIYAAYALLELAQKGTIPAGKVKDEPFMPLRGVHIGLPDREHIPFLKRLIKYLLVPMRYNTIFIEISAGMRYDRHPEINAAWEEIKRKSDSGEWPFNFHTPMVCNGSYLEKDEVRDLFAYAEEYGLEAIPEIHSLSHAQFLTKAFPQIAEIPARSEKKDEVNLLEDDGLDDEFYPSCYCPSNEESYRILFDIIDEVVDALKPKRYLHMGHDEVYRIGVCEKCRGKDPAKLYADDVNRIHDYVASKGLTMMMWSDMLHTATQYKTPPAIDWIPKDIVMLDFIWYFHMDLDLEERILDHGFPVVLGNLYSSHFPRYEKRIRKDGILGGEVSTWVAVTEEDYALEGKMYDLVYTANMLWSAAYRSEARSAYDQCVSALLRRMRPQIHGDSVYTSKEYSPIQLTQTEGAHLLSEKERMILDRWKINWANDAVRFESILHAVPQIAAVPGCPSYKIPITEDFDGFLFVHACDGPAARIPWEKLEQVGEYVVRYEDGGTVSLPIQYGGNTAELLRRYGAPLKTPYFRHEGYIATYFADPAVYGKTENGDDFTLWGWGWENPEPGRKVISIELQTESSSPVGIYLFALSGYRKK